MPNRPQYFMPREQDAAGSWPVGYFGNKTPSGASSPSTIYMEMARQTENAQRSPASLLSQLPINAAAWDALLARAPLSTNIEDRRREPPVTEPEPETAAAEGPLLDYSSDPMAQALGYGAIGQRPIPMPRPRPQLTIGRQSYRAKE
jgi:hypothetical protein